MSEAGGPNGETIRRDHPFVQLIANLCVANDRTGDQLRKQRDVQQVAICTIEGLGNPAPHVVALSKMGRVVSTGPVVRVGTGSLAACEGSLTIQKKVITAEGQTVTTGSHVDGWSFSATRPNSGYAWVTPNSSKVIGPRRSCTGRQRHRTTTPMIEARIEPDSTASLASSTNTMKSRRYLRVPEP